MLRAIYADMPPDRLPLDDGFHPRGRERSCLDAEAGIDHD